MKRISFLVVLLGIGLIVSLSAQDTEIVGFGGLNIGMSFAQIDEQLPATGLFRYRGESDVSFSPGRDRKVLEIDGYDFVQRGILQFVDDQLFSITLIINPARMDHFSLFTRFRDQYGEPNSFGPQRIIWEGSRTRLTLERPLTVQYLDRERFMQQLDESRAEESLRHISRELFLEQF